MTCMYENYNGRLLEFCGEPAEPFIVRIKNKYKLRLGSTIFLCQKHKEFVIDCLNTFQVEHDKAEMKKEIDSTKYKLF